MYPLLAGLTTYLFVALQAHPVPVADTGIIPWEYFHYFINGLPRWQALTLAAINAIVVGATMVVWQENHRSDNAKNIK